MSSWAEDVTVDITELGKKTWNNNSLSSGVVTISTDLNNGSAPTTNNAQYRWKTGNIITISTSTGTLKSIQFKTNSTEAYGPKNLKYSGTAITNSGTSFTWTAPTGIASASFTVSSETRLTEIHVTYTAGSGNSVNAPKFSPVAGTVPAGTEITLTQATADEIRYTLDGTDPTKTTGTVYSGPIVITTAKTIKAIAVESGDVSSVATAAYTIDVATPTFSPESGNYLKGSTFALSASGNKICYTLTTDGSEPANPTTSSEEYSTPIAIIGKTRIKAIAVDSYGNASSVVTRTYTGVTPTTLPFSWTGSSSEGKEELGKLTGVDVSLGGDYATSNAPYRLKFDGEGKFVTIFTDEKPFLLSFSAKLFKATTTGSKMKVQESVDGKEFTDVEEFTVDGAINSTFSFTTTNSFNANTRVVRLVLAEKDQNVGVGNIVVTRAESIAISAAGWATYCSSSALDFTGITTLTAYTASKDGDVVKFNKVTGKVPANTGLLVRGETANVPVCASAEAVSNLLVGVTAETTKDAGTVFVLMKGSKGIGFYKNTNDFTLRANSAYLPAEAVPTADARAFIALDDETTGIADVKAVKEDAEGMFDLQGRKIAKPTKGLYIVNGKKIAVK